MGIARDLVKSIQQMIHDAIDKAPYDRTRKARIVDTNNNKYTISLDGSMYTDIKSLNSQELNIGDVVDVLIPENQVSNMTIINGINSINHIIEQGTSNSWEYRKWSDGTLEAWRTFSMNIPSWTRMGTSNIYYYNGSTNWSFPVGFISTPVFTLTPTSGYYWYTTPKSLTNSTFQVNHTMVSNTTPTAITEYTLSGYCIGKWK